MDKVMLAGILSYGFYAFFVIFGIIAMLRGSDFLMENNKDPETLREIRSTDNGPKEGDDFQVVDQKPEPMTDEEIKAKIEEVIG